MSKDNQLDVDQYWKEIEKTYNHAIQTNDITVSKVIKIQNHI